MAESAVSSLGAAYCVLPVHRARFERIEIVLATAGSKRLHRRSVALKCDSLVAVNDHTGLAPAPQNRRLGVR